jgi:hypothetical protein
MVRRGLAALCALCAVQGSAAAKDWWGEMLPDQPSNFIVGYGSLVNSVSRGATAGSAIPAIPVRVSPDFGYCRTWNDRSPSGFTALGLRKAARGEKGCTINGVLYPVSGADMAKYDAREQGYARLEVPRDALQPVSWERLPAKGMIWIYVPLGRAGMPGAGLPAPDAEYPLLESYIDVVVEGGLEYGDAFARELLETTEGWSDYWLNDRELARRPWVRDPKSAAVDVLLGAVEAPAAKLTSRLFTEPYALRWGGQKAQ